MKKSTIYCFIIFLSLTTLAYFFPLTGSDLGWAIKNVEDITTILNMRDSGLLPSILSTIFIKYKIIRIAFVGLSGMSFFYLIKNIVDKKNDVLMLIAFFLLFLTDRLFIGSIIVQTTGFTNYFGGTLGVLLFLNILLKNRIPKKNVFLFILGLILSNLELPFAFAIFAFTIVYLVLKEDDIKKSDIALTLGELIGILFVTSRMHVDYVGFTANLIHEFTRIISGQNFAITLIFSGFVLFEGIRVYTYGKKSEATLSIIGISTYLLTSLLSTNDYINYAAFIIYSASCIYILLNLGNSLMFKKKVLFFYIFKLIYIIMICIFGNITVGSTFPLFVIDFMIILEFYDQILPNEFLWPIWLGVIVILSGMNIYIYKDAKLKYDSMNTYIKNKLECSTEEIKLPSKYEIDLLNDYIPKTEKEIEEYIKYYGIHPYEREDRISVTFRRDTK